MSATYLDSSAIVKLVVRKPETDALLRYLAAREVRVSSAIARTEVLRALLLAGEEAQQRGVVVLEAIELVALTDDVLDAAAQILPPTVCSLDAIHIATAAMLKGDIETLVTYDRRMLEGAIRSGLDAISPGA